MQFSETYLLLSWMLAVRRVSFCMPKTNSRCWWSPTWTWKPAWRPPSHKCWPPVN